MINLSGAEFKRFYRDPHFWPDDEGATWHEEETICVNGDEVDESYDLYSIPDVAHVTLAGGIVYGPSLPTNAAPSLEDYFLRWRQAQHTTFLLVECDRTAIDPIIAAVIEHNGKVIQ
ncbi:uncharacterized protein NMK_1851 [Novimethylophilus kurashikiensis]|uniref:Uncharacterized protein n=1 Tax=Novimethylophilus kurashikiensis TaxID=1825523 RepID=A0A2R5F8C7_9PROT|nr:hypothetical protein [Novimethylophilus kurashikiensis]GBG14285.1 uncharacterized protein NMK_1851 [Novimethylophilus kurashikiensis]